MSTLSELSLDLFLDTRAPVRLNTRSDEVLEAGMHKYFLARMDNVG